MKKKVDPRVRALIEASVASNHRSLFVIVGDKGRHQVVNLHYMLSKATIKARPSVLWCYKKELGFSSHKQKRIKQLKKMAHRSGTDLEKMKEDPFELFISSTKIRYCYYSETHKILGNTFGMCVLQDFEALTPNLLARTIETVEGGGVVVILLKSMSSLKQLYAMTMDVHSRFRTEAHKDVVARFNERFLLSLGKCSSALVLDDELNVLPISSSSRSMLSSPQTSEDASKSSHDTELKELCDSLKDTQPIGNLVALARTIDQAKCLLTFMEAVSDKTLRSTVAMTAGRGRGKSAALGISIAGAIAYGYSNIFVTSPSPENLNTLFEFVLKAFDALEYKEHLDYQVVQSSNPSFNNCIVRINVFHSHRQTIQYVQPQHSHFLSQAELVVVDEAAAIPLPLVKKMMGPYLLFLSSTINGYEGTGRSLSLKLIQQLRESQARGASSSAIEGDDSAGVVRAPKRSQGTEESSMQASGGRLLRELKLEVPIRYSSGDKVEQWLNELLCLDCTNKVPALRNGCPHPSSCELYYVERDTLFSYHKVAEDFLQNMMSLYVSSHYKNSPNDLQLLSDAPAHQIFVLLGPVDDSGTSTPDILCVLQVCLEGQISKESVMSQLSRGVRQAGDLIPWTISQQFQDAEFAGLSGARVVRIATHPEVSRMGYGSRAVELLSKFYAGELIGVDEAAAAKTGRKEKVEGGAGSKLLEEKITERKELPPLLVPVASLRPERLDYLGVSYGITGELFRFWRRADFRCVYVRQTASDLTGEHTCICLKELNSEEAEKSWLLQFEADFRKRFESLLGFDFNKFHPSLPLAVLEPTNVSSGGADGRTDGSSGEEERRRRKGVTAEELGRCFTHYDLKRLDSYASNVVDHHIVLDLVPSIAQLYFLDRIPVSLSFTQAAILLGIGLQHKSVDELEKEMKLEARQILANFNKLVLRISKFFRSLREEDASKDLVKRQEIISQPLQTSLEDELDREGKKVAAAQRKAAESMLEEMEYAVPGEGAWEAALTKVGGRTPPSSISLPKRKAMTPAAKETSKEEQENEKGSSKKRKNHRASNKF